MKILPSAIAIAITNELNSMLSTGSRVVPEVPTNRMRP